MPESVSDVRSHSTASLAQAVRAIGRSVDRRLVFEAVYSGHKKIKTIEDIKRRTGIRNEIIVLQRANELYSDQIINRIKVKGRWAYTKDAFYSRHRHEILALAKSKTKLTNFMKRDQPSGQVEVRVKLPGQLIKTKMITVDDIASLSKVRTISHNIVSPKPIKEAVFKRGFKQIICEGGKFQDWGGEGNDLLTTRFALKKGKRISAAFGFKGRGTKGVLYPKKMGKRGDQIARLFKTPAQAFLVQYWAQIDESVLEALATQAKMKSYYEGKIIYYGIIDGQDTARLLKAYPKQFK
ncbi:MAG TPA: hypothetical protein VNE86_03395 [Nitrososphaerales archaeon]|nr:hypothetical protein [Nitrososphaerales archaeon]